MSKHKPHPTIGRSTALAAPDKAKLARIDADLEKIAASLRERHELLGRALNVSVTTLSCALQ